MIRPFVEAGLREELAAGDTTGGFLVLNDDPVQTGQIYAKDYGIVCGLLLADETIRMLDDSAEVEHAVRDGDEVTPGTTLLKITARTSTFFAVERDHLPQPFRSSQQSPLGNTVLGSRQASSPSLSAL